MVVSSVTSDLFDLLIHIVMPLMLHQIVKHVLLPVEAEPSIRWGGAMATGRSPMI